MGVRSKKAPPLERVPIGVVTKQLGKLADRVRVDRDPIVFTRYGDPYVALVSIADLEKIRAVR